jgi:hypothetical protein
MEPMSEVSPSEIELVLDESDGFTTSILDLMLTIRDNNISTSIYDKRDAFDFPIVSFTNLSGNISQEYPADHPSSVAQSMYTQNNMKRH